MARAESFDVFGTLISVRDGSYAAFERILRDAGAHHVDIRAFWEAWEERNIEAYWHPYLDLAYESQLSGVASPRNHLNLQRLILM
jgi:hypothetical protein